MSAPRAEPSFPPQFAAALADLTQLQELVADGWMPAAGLCHLPASLRKLCLEACHSGDSTAAGQRTQVSISHLTKLESLHLFALGGVSAQSQLPACLTRLKLVGAADAVSGLCGLQHLELCQTDRALLFLQQVAQQARLQRLDLALHICSSQELQQVFSALSSCTQLTQLHLFSHDAEPGAGSDTSVNLSGMQVHMQLSKLRQLQQLKLTFIQWDSWGPSQLTVLSALTQLRLEHCDMSELGLAVIFQRLTGLRELEVAETLPADELLLVSLGCSSNLERLCSQHNNFEWTDETLPLLSPLTKLTELCLYGADFFSTVSPIAERAFLAGMPHLRRIYWH
jgi:BarA-like signal transduction histidine kinase